jgi:hypothetical protein
MNSKPINTADRRLVSRLQNQLYETRKRLNISAPGVVLYRADVSYGDDEVALVEADGLGGAVLRVVEGNYPVDYLTRSENAFSTEAEAVRAAENFHALAGQQS